MNADLSVTEGRVALSGPLTALGLGALWPRAVRAARKAAGGALVIDIAGASVLDTSGAALLLAMEASHGGVVTLYGADDRINGLLAQLRAALPDPQASSPKAERAPVPGLFDGIRVRITFFGEMILAAVGLPVNLRLLRGADFARITDRAGLQALPLVLLLGFLIGMILAFQSAVPMRQFGADLYVANLVAISLFRELGPLLVAMILAGRTGSAFAAELGTMQVNEEIAALTTMGIDPATMLVLPRMAAAMLVMPGLTVAMDVAGLLGMGLVLMLFGFPPSAIVAQITSSSGPSDLLLGMGKGMVFAGAVALIGCRAGLTAGSGPRAVGEAATAAVVGGIVTTVALDGIFAVITYRLGL
ncbi:MAG: ABC transporter permease [Acidocella sp. 20-63-7]|nr:MAG: ABC transporter permease [Acidocella sp. 20-63-7]HQT46498.1 ABC transporter permease [Acidocella sp.]